jgi:3-phenylpropionate/cinnamic acid dioxygenase small subunit
MNDDTTDRLLARAEIAELTARYNRAFDDRDVAGFIAVFTADAVVEEVGAAAHRGIEAIRAFAERESDGSTVHATTDAIVTLDGDRARQRCTLILALRRPDRSKVSLFATGRYDDELVRTADGWRFSRRTITLDRAR